MKVPKRLPYWMKKRIDDLLKPPCAATLVGLNAEHYHGTVTIEATLVEPVTETVTTIDAFIRYDVLKHKIVEEVSWHTRDYAMLRKAMAVSSCDPTAKGADWSKATIEEITAPLPPEDVPEEVMRAVYG